MRRSSFGVCAALAVAWVSAAALQADDPIVPVFHEPHHRQVFQYGPTRILDLQIPPGDKSWFHSHESPVLYVTLGTSRTRTQNLGEEWGGGGAARGGAGRGGAAPAPDANAAGGATPPRPARATGASRHADLTRLEHDQLCGAADHPSAGKYRRGSVPGDGRHQRNSGRRSHHPGSRRLFRQARADQPMVPRLPVCARPGRVDAEASSYRSGCRLPGVQPDAEEWGSAA